MAAKDKAAKEPLTFNRYLDVARNAYASLGLEPPEANPPPKNTKLSAIETALGHALPEALRAAWLVADAPRGRAARTRRAKRASRTEQAWPRRLRLSGR